MAFTLVAVIFFIVLVLYALKPGTTFNISLFGKDYYFSVTSTS
jgi:hypothetical protein